MLIGCGRIQLKAHNDAELTPQEELRLRAIVAELTYSAIAAFENARAADNALMRHVPPAVVAREIGSSKAMRKAWLAFVEEELREYRMEDFADEVARMLKPAAA